MGVTPASRPPDAALPLRAAAPVRGADGRPLPIVFEGNAPADLSKNRWDLKTRKHKEKLRHHHVKTAGAHGYNPTYKVLDYIAQAGGANTDAHLRFVKVLRSVMGRRLTYAALTT